MIPLTFGTITPVYVNAKAQIIFAYDQNVISFNLHTGDSCNDILSSLKLLVYLREVVCERGKVMEEVLTGSAQQINKNIVNKLPNLPKREPMLLLYRTKGSICNSIYTTPMIRIRC